MKRSGPWKLWAVGALAGATFALAAVGIAALSGAAGPLAFAETHDRRAYELLTASSHPARLDAAAAEATRALTLSPYNNSARLRLTYIDTIRRGSVGPVGLAHLQTSYDLIPIDHTVAAWRVRFALEHWRELPPVLRRSVQTEALTFGRTGSQDADVRSALASIRSPEGRLTAALWRRALDRPSPQRRP